MNRRYPAPVTRRSAVPELKLEYEESHHGVRQDFAHLMIAFFAWRTESQFPVRMPTGLALFTRAIPAANSGAR